MHRPAKVTQSSFIEVSQATKNRASDFSQLHFVLKAIQKRGLILLCQISNFDECIRSKVVESIFSAKLGEITLTKSDQVFDKLTLGNSKF
jgi:hypothetical protein